MEGPMRTSIEAELLNHATEELKHAQLLIDRIIELDGTPVLSPEEWPKLASCNYYPPVDPYVEVILDQNLQGERCAIKRYQQIASITDGKDFATHEIAVQILSDELEHERDIEDWLKDIQQMKLHIQ